MNKSKVKIGISGKMRSGKGTTSETMSKRLYEYGLMTEVLSLAGPLKKLVKEGLGRTDREALQIFGTDIVRAGCKKYFGTDDIWVNYMISDANNHSMADVVICNDVRFPNEADAMKADGWLLIRIETTEAEQLSRPIEGDKRTEGLNHASETSLDNYDKFDIVIPSGITLAQLQANVINIVDTIIAPKIGKLSPDHPSWTPVSTIEDGGENNLGHSER